MLYVSKILEDGGYIVTDDIDNKEYYFDIDAIHNYVDRIKGVIFKKKRVHGERVIDKIEVCKPKEGLDAQLAKAKFLSGAHIVMEIDELIGISVQPPNGVAQVRLSDFATKLGEMILFNYVFTGSVTLILDDSLQFDKRTFDGWYGKVKLNLKEVTKMSAVDMILYDSMFEDFALLGRYPSLETEIIDIPERKGYAQALWLLSTSFDNDNQYAFAKKLIDEMHPNVSALVAKRYRRRFINLCKRAIKLQSYLYIDEVNRVIRSLKTGYNCYEFVHSLSSVIDIDTRMLTKLYNYITFFDADKDIKAACVDFVDRVGQALIEFREKELVGQAG